MIRSNGFSTLRSVGLATLAALSVTWAGCAGQAPWVQARTAAALSCTPAQVTATHTGGDVWRARGCGREGLFHCAREPWLGMRCRPEGPRS